MKVKTKYGTLEDNIIVKKMNNLSKHKLVKEKTQLEEELYRRRMEQFMIENPMILSDDVPDKFDEWMSERIDNN